MTMTTQIGTFGPLQGQHTGLGFAGLNQAGNWGFTGWNPNAGLNQTGFHYQQNTPVHFVPTFGTNYGEIAQGLLPNSSAIAFVPHQSQVAGSAFVPTTYIGAGAPIALHPGNAFVGGIGHGNMSAVSQSFATELFENNHEYVLSFDVPGIDIEDLDISLSGNTVYINGIRKDSRESSNLAYSEIAKGSITRAIAVPFDVSGNKAINTSLENGVLKIRIAKESGTDKRQTARKVKIG